MVRRTTVNTLVAVAVTFFLASHAVAQTPATRVVMVIRDRTPSFARYVGDANEAIIRIISRLGPGDTLIMIDLGGPFDARTHVHDMAFEPIPTNALQPPRTLLEHRKAQAIIDARWESAKQAKIRAVELLSRQADRKGTDIPSVLDYAAHLLASFSSDRHLIVLSDLETDTTGVRTSLPPRVPFRFPAVSVTAMFVPWKGSAQTGLRMERWQEWFAKAGARSFTSYDEAQSRIITPLEVNQVPRRALSPFVRVGDVR
jgi:hypothetical protein